MLQRLSWVALLFSLLLLRLNGWNVNNFRFQREQTIEHQSVLFDRQKANEEQNICVETGRVMRLAARAFHPEHSKPSSQQYTTRKEEMGSVQVMEEGVVGDYNHYRTMALDSTPDRAVSILTTDTLALLRSHKYPVKDGDLGENVLVDGVDYRFFVPGQRYRIGEDEEKFVILEITEPMVPCGNLCKLTYINDDSKSPKERIATCQDFLGILAQHLGLRGWYAKVVRKGKIERNASIRISR